MPAGSDMGAMGTGWLIKPDLLVTAGHVVYDHSGNDGNGYGKLRIMQCYIGYNGRDSLTTGLKDGSVQSRFAKKVVTTGEWVDSRDNRHRDVAFIQLATPFKGNLRLFSFVSTPMKSTEMIGVVGYPGDMRINDSDGVDEPGAQMYELFSEIKYDRNDNALKMLQYRISTFGGQSGSPVIRKKAGQVSIGAHCYGGADTNSASPIGPDFGNDYNAYLSVFNTSYPSVKAVGGIKFVKPTSSSTGSTVTVPVASDPKAAPGTEDFFGTPDSEGFFDSLKSVINVVSKVGQTVLPLASPLLGPLGGPVSAIAGAALGAVANATATESAFVDVPKASQGATERAVLAEATLQSVLKINDPDLSGKIMKDMQATYSQLSPHVTNLAPKLVPLLKDSALRLAVNQDYLRKKPILLNQRQNIVEGTESAIARSPFVDGLLAPTKAVDGEEGFFGGLGSFLSKAVSVAKPFAITGAKIGLQMLNNALAPSGTESTESLSPDDQADLDAATLVTKRAVMAEAALRAVMKLNADDLAKASSSSGDSGTGAEGFFDSIKGAVQSIGSAVVKAAPKVISTLVPIAVNVLQKKLAGSSESAPMNGSSNGVSKKKSLSFAEIDAAALNGSGGFVQIPAKGLKVSPVPRPLPLEERESRPVLRKQDPLEFKAPNRDSLVFDKMPHLHQDNQS
ncbi:uncharacterized protein N7482_000192 [Penicillium canariense]|uniref:Serine protease n=1 Tax=Penicillium canariense TaxID=189055 RepID=A0A9W9IBE5_9EURO|nr:uncharacterized protein N7482_000192 [Penicillium canariense]KAJ5174315.1 hypothetical protein N7482_000192 [Penicillium canariense]